MLNRAFSFAMFRFALLLQMTFFPSWSIGQTEPVLAPGFPLLFDTSELFNPIEGPTLADLNRDGRLEILVVGGTTVFAFQTDGSLLPGWPQATTYPNVNSPAVGDLDNDGNLDVVICDRFGFGRKSFLYAWNASGQLLPGFPQEFGLAATAATLYDLDGDGALEIINSFERQFYVFNHDGSVRQGWPKDLAPFAPISKASVGGPQRGWRT